MGVLVDGRPLEGEVPGLSKPSTRKGQLQRQALVQLLRRRQRGELPTSIRFLFYELEQRGVTVKNRGINPATGQQYVRRSDTDLSDAMTRLREAGLVPWDWLIDDTRTVHNWSCEHPTVAELARAYIEHVHVNPWDGPAPLLLTESRTVGGVLERSIAREYRAPVAATNGQVGGFLHTDVAPLLRGNDRPVIYIGDSDLQGDQIEANTRKVLAEITGRSGLDWTRVALTEPQVADLRRGGVEPIEKLDHRYRPARRIEAFEVEALGQATVTDLVRFHLDTLLPEALEDVQEREDGERAELLELLDDCEDDEGRRARGAARAARRL